VRLVAESRDGELGYRARRLGIARASHLHRPARIGVLLCRLVRFVLPDLARLAPGLDLRLLARRVALARRSPQAGIHDLPTHREVAAGPQLAVELDEQRVDRA